MVHIKFSNKFHYFRRIWPNFSIDHKKICQCKITLEHVNDLTVCMQSCCIASFVCITGCASQLRITYTYDLTLQCSMWIRYRGIWSSSSLTVGERYLSPLSHTVGYRRMSPRNLYARVYRPHPRAPASIDRYPQYVACYHYCCNDTRDLQHSLYTCRLRTKRRHPSMRGHMLDWIP